MQVEEDAREYDLFVIENDTMRKMKGVELPFGPHNVFYKDYIIVNDEIYSSDWKLLAAHWIFIWNLR